MEVDKQVEPQSNSQQQQQQQSSSADNVTSGNPRPVVLPVSRIKTIMKTCPDTSMISQEAAVVVTKSTVSVLICINYISALYCGVDVLLELLF